jgi:hypothetical protein
MDGHASVHDGRTHDAVAVGARPATGSAAVAYDAPGCGRSMTCGGTAPRSLAR